MTAAAPVTACFFCLPDAPCKDHANPAPPPRTAAATPAVVFTGGEDPYARKAIEEECWTVANTPPGSRNDQLNVSSFKLASLVDAGRLDRENTIELLKAAGRGCGLTESEIGPTINSAFKGSAEKVGARIVPELPEIPPAFTIDPEESAGQCEHEETENGRCTKCGEESGWVIAPSEGEQRDLHTLAVERRAYEYQVNEDARLLFATRQAQKLGQDAPNPIPLPDFLAVPDEDADYRITDLLPTGGRALLAAQQKAGKTSLIANLIRALADGDQFLGRFSVTPVRRVTLIDNELDTRMLRRWLREQNIQNTELVHVISLKGKIATFDIQTPSARAQWADKIRGSDFVILDCLRPCLDVLGLSEDKDAGRFLVAWDALMSEVGDIESVVVHHMGHNDERSRGDSRLVDWPDVNWRIIKESQSDDADMEEVGGDGGRRFFTAHGRDVNVPESVLTWTEETRSISIGIGGRKKIREDRAVLKSKYERESILCVLHKNPNGLTKNAFMTKLGECGIGEERARKAITNAINDGIVETSPAPNRGQLHKLHPSAVPEARDLATGGGGGVPPKGEDHPPPTTAGHAPAAGSPDAPLFEESAE